MNNTHKFLDIRRIFMKVRAWNDSQIDRQTKCINAFQLCWKVLKKLYAMANQFKCEKEGFFLGSE